MRTPGTDGPLEWVWLVLFAAVTIGAGAFLSETPVDALIYCLGIWATVLYLIGPETLLVRLGLRSGKKRRAADTVE